MRMCRIASTVAATVVAMTFLSAALAGAQDRPSAPMTIFELTLKDGSRLYGAVEQEDDTSIVFRSVAGVVITAPRGDVQSLRPVEGTLADGEFRPGDPNATRLFFGPTARSLAKGRTYFGVYEFLMPFVQVGVTDQFSIGGGTPLLFGFDEGERPFWITPKLQVLDTGRTQVAVGAFHAFVDGGNDGIAYGVVTTGRTEASITVGAGYAYSSDGGHGTVVMIGGERQASRHVSFVTENYIWRGGHGVVTGGVRFFGERLSADVGLAVPLGTGERFALPVVNFVYVF
jgi:hypothetical protein